MMADMNPRALRAAIDFLSRAAPADGDGLPATIDYAALVARAEERGFVTDEKAMAEAFRVLMRMRIAHLRSSART